MHLRKLKSVTVKYLSFLDKLKKHHVQVRNHFPYIKIIEYSFSCKRISYSSGLQGMCVEVTHWIFDLDNTSPYNMAVKTKFPPLLGIKS